MCLMWRGILGLFMRNSWTYGVSTVEGHVAFTTDLDEFHIIPHKANNALVTVWYSLLNPSNAQVFDTITSHAETSTIENHLGDIKNGFILMISAQPFIS